VSDEKPKGGIYRHAGSGYWWISYYDGLGQRRRVSSKTADEALARERWLALDKQSRVEQRAIVRVGGPETVGAYAERWLKDRHERHIAKADGDEDRLRHLPRLLAMPIESVRRIHVQQAFAGLMTAPVQKRLAPRTIRHIYGTLRTLFGDALAEGLVVAQPCTLLRRRGELPANVDKDELWRRTAIFARHEIATLISDERLPERRRVLYALMFLAGPRIGEVCARRWGDYDPEAQPLGSLVVHSTYQLRTRRMKAPKSGRSREVPVHPTLAAILAQWRLSGWREAHGRHPTQEDFIIPSLKGKVLSSNSSYDRLRRDLILLKMRHRRQHDTRRSFITYALADGARRDYLKWITHGPDGSIMDEYNTPPWDGLCEAVSKLRISLRIGEITHLLPCHSVGTDD
jgi:integrase